MAEALGARVAVIGATGLVGSAIVEQLAEHGWDAARVVALGSDKAVGKRVDFGDTGLWVDDVNDFDFSKVAMVFIAVPGDRSESYLKHALENGCRVIDCYCGALRDGSVLGLASEFGTRLANADVVQLPHPAAFVTGMLLEKFKDSAYVQQVRVQVLQPVSAYGRLGMKTLAGEAVSLLSGKPPETKSLGCQLAFNVIPGLPAALVSYASAEDIADQIRILSGDDLLPVDVSLATVPVFFGTTCRLDFEFSESQDVQLFQAALENDPWFRINELPTPVTEGTGDNKIVVGNIISDDETAYRLSMWLVVDNVKTAAARHAVMLGAVLQKHFQ